LDKNNLKNKINSTTKNARKISNGFPQNSKRNNPEITQKRLDKKQKPFYFKYVFTKSNNGRKEPFYDPREKNVCTDLHRRHTHFSFIKLLLKDEHG